MYRRNVGVKWDVDLERLLRDPSSRSNKCGVLTKGTFALAPFVVVNVNGCASSLKVFEYPWGLGVDETT
jgi:hypothetical protein